MGNNLDSSALYSAILKLKTVKDAEEFFSDLCTKKELDSMTQRVVAGKLLLAGETYEKIISKTDISSATLSRVSRCVKYGRGYKKFLWWSVYIWIEKGNFMLPFLLFFLYVLTKLPIRNILTIE